MVAKNKLDRNEMTKSKSLNQFFEENNAKS